MKKTLKPKSSLYFKYILEMAVIVYVIFVFIIPWIAWIEPEKDSNNYDSFWSFFTDILPYTLGGSTVLIIIAAVCQLTGFFASWDYDKDKLVCRKVLGKDATFAWPEIHCFEVSKTMTYKISVIFENFKMGPSIAFVCKDDFQDIYRAWIKRKNIEL